MPIGENIRSQRDAAGVSQAYIAKAFGVRQGTVSTWELGKRKPPVTILPKLAEILQCSILDFFKE